MKHISFLLFIAMACCSCRGEGIKVGEYFQIYDPSINEPNKWYINDHCFIRDSNGTWHLFGITHKEPALPMDERNFAHATSDSLTRKGWKKEPFALSYDPKQGEVHLWAPHVIYQDGTYYMFYCAGAKDHRKYMINLATSKDLYSWERHLANPMIMDGYDARDPYIFRLGDKWIMYYTATSTPAGGNHTVATRASTDLLGWSDKKVVFVDPSKGTWGGPTESPTVVRRGPFYYLFIGPRDDYRCTSVYRSKDPFKWTLEDQVAKINSHAAEIVRDVDGKWYVSHCGWEQGGVYLAPLEWNDGIDDNDTSMPVPSDVNR